MEIERRSFGIKEVRVASREGGGKKITGYSAVFNSLSEDLGGFYERIQQGAFTKTLQEADIRALFNHDPNYPLGRVKANTLRLAEDEIGLGIEIDLPDTQYASDLAVSIERGDVDQMSF
ncbi:MAG: HK97 family phage prohead protease, partial [Anaerolineaceae bacterium]|nr:HK97 family phage prohead protease [Anaerolineaceae bacterium]